MKLSLLHFGCYDKAEFTFLDSGTVLLSAPSGKGKSTIIRAIVFAIYGTGQKLVQYGKKKCKVELEFRNLHIIRTKGPCRLIVHKDDKMYEDDEAQSILNQVMPRRFTDTSFLSMSPSDKISFLESIIFESIDIKSAKATVRSRIRECEQQLLSCEVEHTTVSKLLAELGPPEPPVEEITESADILQAQLLDWLARKEARADVDRRLDRARDGISRLSEYILSDTEKICALGSFPESKQDLERFRDELHQAEEYRRLQRDLDAEEYSLTQLETIKNELSGRISEYDPTLLKRKRDYRATMMTRDDLIRQLDLVPAGSVQEEESLRSQLDELQTRAREAKSVYVCPECQVCLVLQNNSLKKSASQARDPCIDAQIMRVRSNLDKLVGAKATRSHLENRIKQAETRLDGNNQTLAEITREISELESKFQLVGSDKEKLKDVTRAIQRIQTKQDRIATLHPPVEVPYSMNEIQDRLVVLATIETHRSRIQANERERRRFQKEMEDLLESNTDSITEIDDAICALRLRIQQREAYEAYSRMHQVRVRYATMIDEFQVKITQYRAKLQAELEFKNKLEQAETVALSQLVQTINVHVQMYLDVFFESEPMQANLTVGSSKPQISVLYKNVNTELSCLSTGEFDRVALAYSLAIQSILQQPVILLDECVSSLDQENADVVFHAISSFHRDKLVILIAHQIVTGMFDQVVQL